MLWFAQSFVFYGLVYSLPYIYRSETGAHTYLDMMLSALAEIPGMLLCALLIDRPVVGRRRLLWTCMLGVTLSCLGCMTFDPDSWAFNPLTFLAKFFVSITFATIFPYTLEIYPTACRTTGAGHCCGTAAGGPGPAWRRLDGLMSRCQHACQLHHTTTAPRSSSRRAVHPQASGTARRSAVWAASARRS